MEEKQVEQTTIALPGAGTWTLNPSMTSVGFIARKLMVSKVRGAFEKFEGTVVISEKPEDTTMVATIDVASLNTNEEKRDTHLRSADFFDVEKYPHMTFKSTKIDLGDGTHWKLTGDLTIKDMTRPITLDVEYAGMHPTPWGFEQAVFSAKTSINRDDWGLTWNMALETGGFLVGPNIDIEIEAAVKPS
jgi:polyisoprenoid-binding protein YceI